MADVKQCDKANAHADHEWTEEVALPNELGKLRNRVRLQYHWCGGREKDLAPSTAIAKEQSVSYHELDVVKIQFETREGVPTELSFSDLLKGDAVASITLVEGEEAWAFVQVRFMARKPYTTREVE